MNPHPKKKKKQEKTRKKKQKKKNLQIWIQPSWIEIQSYFCNLYSLVKVYTFTKL